jgi:hypothetical protein
MSLADIGADFHADPDFAFACTVTVPGGDPVATTVRPVNSQATDPQTRAAKRDNLSCLLYLLTSVIAGRPPKGTVVVITGDTPYAGSWRTAEAAEPSSAGEWRCPAVIITTINAIAASAGSPRPPST